MEAEWPPEYLLIIAIALRARALFETRFRGWNRSPASSYGLRRDRPERHGNRFQQNFLKPGTDTVDTVGFCWGRQQSYHSGIDVNTVELAPTGTDIDIVLRGRGGIGRERNDSEDQQEDATNPQSITHDVPYLSGSWRSGLLMPHVLFDKCFLLPKMNRTDPVLHGTEI